MTSDPASREPLVTVAMAVRNNAETVGVAIRSILAQTYGSFEFVIVNDGSTDGTAGVIAGFEDCRIRVIDDGQSKGLAARLNQIVDEARGAYVARMDGDDFSYPDRFARQVAFLEARPDVDLVGSSAIAFGPSGAILGAFVVPESHAALVARPEIGFAIPHPTWMGRMEWFRRVPYSAALKRGQDQAKLLASYRTSGFANLTVPLLGYRQDIPKINQITQSRLPYLGAVVSQAVHERDWGLAGRCAVQQLGRTAVTVTELAMGRGERMLARRFRAVTHEERDRFIDVRDGLISLGR
ncbi:MAG: glycosyltransferase family A protein [Hyphomicrobiaceae bacterium]